MPPSRVLLAGPIRCWCVPLLLSTQELPGLRQEWPEGAAMCLVTPRARSMCGVPPGLEVRLTPAIWDALGEVHHRGEGDAVEVENYSSGKLNKLLKIVMLFKSVRGSLQ